MQLLFHLNSLATPEAKHKIFIRTDLHYFNKNVLSQKKRHKPANIVKIANNK